MKLRDSFSTFALALADIAKSLRVYVQHTTQQRVPQVRDPSEPVHPTATLSVIDDEELWKHEQETNLRYLVRETQAELEASELEQAQLAQAAASAPKHERLLVEDEASDEAKASHQPVSRFDEQW